MVTRTELTKLKKQASQIAQAKGGNIDDLMAIFLQEYIQKNFEWVLDAFAKQNSQKITPNNEQPENKSTADVPTYKGDENE